MSSKVKKNKNKLDNKNFSKIKRIQVKEAGITLVALVITIIVLLILAMISISSAVSGNGIFARAQKAGNLWRDAERNEQTSLNSISDELGKYVDNKPNTPGGDEPSDEDLSQFYGMAYDTDNDGWEDTIVYSHTNNFEFTQELEQYKYNSSTYKCEDTGNKIKYTFNPSNASLIFGKYTNEKNENVDTGISYYTLDQKWTKNDPKYEYADINYDHCNNKITNVIILNRIKLNNYSGLFEGFWRLQNIYNIENIDTCEATSFRGMFSGCYGLASLDLTSFTTTASSDVSSMFWYCEKLKQVKVSNKWQGAKTGNNSWKDYENSNYSLKNYGMFDGAGCSSVTVV